MNLHTCPSYASLRRFREEGLAGPGMGLYQSGHMELDSPEAAEGPYRLFLRLFGDGRVSMVLSPAEAEEVYQQFDSNRHMAGKIEYTVSPDGISFDFGPTAHSVTAIGEARIRLQSVYPNGRENQEELTLVIPERQP